MNVMRTVSLAAFVFFVAASPVHAEPWAELEIGPAFQGRNDVRIPGDGGTRISLTDDLTPSPGVYGRARLGWDIGRHRLFGTAAPVRLTSEGTLSRDLVFRDATYAAGRRVEAEYKFNTYRLTYRYQVVSHSFFELGLGASALLRDAHVRVDDGATRRTKSDLGMVPLLRLELRGHLTDWLSLACDVDGLASPQGRAFDVLTAVEFPAWEHFTPYVGYRFIEGGSDIDEVYNFALLHFVAAGLRASL